MTDVTARLHAIQAIEHLEATRLVRSSAEWVQSLAPGNRQRYFVTEQTHTYNEDAAVEWFLQLRIQGKSWSEIAKLTWLPAKECKQLWKEECNKLARLLPSKPQLRWSNEGTSNVLRNKGHHVARVYRLPGVQGLGKQGFQFRTSNDMIGVHLEERTAMDVAKWHVLQMLMQRQGRQVG